jgi:hypothetical protein
VDQPRVGREAVPLSQHVVGDTVVVASIVAGAVAGAVASTVEGTVEGTVADTAGTGK